MKKLVCLICVLGFLVYCGPKQADVDTIIEDGIEVVLNHLEPYRLSQGPSSLRLEEVLSIDTERDEIADKVSL